MDILTQKKMLGKHELKNPVTGAAINLRMYARCDGMVADTHRKMYEEYGNSGMGMVVTDAHERKPGMSEFPYHVRLLE